MQYKNSHLIMAGLTILTTALTVMPASWAARPGQNGAKSKAEFKVLHEFSGKKPLYPAGPAVAQGRDGSLYTTTSYGGTYDDGIVLKITTGGSLTVLVDFDSYNGSTGLTLGTDGNLYGTTFYGNNNLGTVFDITPGGDLTTLYDFSGPDYDAYPDAPPIEASDGNFYGTARGDFSGGGGEVYRMTQEGDETALFKFDGADGAAPADPLIQASDGNFYGTTNVGGGEDCGGYGCGTVFKVTLKGVLTVLHSFEVGRQIDGIYPCAPVTEGADGALYGTVLRGGYHGDGIIFRVTKQGKYTILDNFDGKNGEAPYTGLVLATDGNFYGVTLGGARFIWE